MTILTKWGIALVCVLVLIWLMVNHYFLDISPTQQNLLSSKSLSNKVAEQQLAHGLALWRNKKYQESAQAFSSLGSQNLNEDLQSLTRLYQYHATAFNKNRNSDFMQQLSSLPDNCKQKLLFVTADIESLVQAESVRSRFAQDQRLKSLPICIYDVTWFDPVDIVCEENWHQSGRLGCQLLSLAEKLKRLPFTHLVMFANKGKANVHNGVMFLDRQDTYDVFIHELAHFSGFIDEYPLSQGLAKRVCAGVDAPNIVFKQAQQLEVDRQYWQSIGLQNNTDIFAARTCDNHSTQAFKASKQLTFMEYHDTGFIPNSYLIAWQRQLHTTPNQPSAHINFAQLYEQSNNLSESQFWRARYQQYLSASTNKINIL
ncbi:hypothetical protein [Paraglaciecola sp. MB-3u-78]|uniref:hypothetical protein n=1 Tax=Paraglaciecola sp. MB-3u-78 TaxID=2058332 RepID=UPI000C34A895|nr:hypothetical protein [Paraglaciecola sp. MB-3u-78]PKH00148.1 hypothetical protein CXF95_05865 [Paraglaciecola sp. MB-3u-78]